MSIEKLMHHYQFAPVKLILISLGVFFLVLIGSAFIGWLLHRLKKPVNEDMVFHIGILLGVTVGFVFFIYFNFNAPHGTPVEIWKTNHLKTYLEQQDEQKIMIDEYVIIPESKRVAIYTSKPKEKDLITVKLAFTKNSTPNEIQLTTVRKKEDIQTPYLTYKKVEKTISEKFSKDDYYEAVLHVPNDSETNVK